MNLFIDTISKKSTMILFDDQKNIIEQQYFEINGNESSLLVPNIDKFIKQNKLDYFDIKNIIIVNWPGSFTWVRTAVLGVNTINFITDNHITAINYFDQYNDYPIIKTSSRRDSFVQKSESSDIQIIPNPEIDNYLEQNNIKKIYWDYINSWVQTIDNIDYCDIIKKTQLQKNKQIKAMYIKKPNIC